MIIVIVLMTQSSNVKLAVCAIIPILITIIIVSHSMEDLAEHADRLLVMHEGMLVMDGPVREVFKYRTELENMGLAVPEATAVMSDLVKMGLNVRSDIITVEEAKKEILRAFGR